MEMYPFPLRDLVIFCYFQQSESVCKEVVVTGDGVNASKAKIVLDKVSFYFSN